jgi:hypothetical protein
MEPEGKARIIASLIAMLDSYDVNDEDWHKVSGDPARERRLADYIKAGCPEDSAVRVGLDPESEARRYLGPRFLGPHELSTLLGFSYPFIQLERFARTVRDFQLFEPFSSELCLIAGPPNELNLLQVRDLAPALFTYRVMGWFGDEKETFSRADLVKPGQWLVILPEGVPDTEHMSYLAQKNRIPRNLRVPNAAEVCYAIMVMAAAKVRNMSDRITVRTSSMTKSGVQVTVEYHSRTGTIGVNDNPSNEAKVDVRIAAAL